jgi:tripartite-type tricarboxylate transporter receptor subunit TctC
MKKISRRHLLHFGAVGLASPALLSVAQAQSYPARAVRILVGFPPGGVNDIIARLIAEKLSDRFGQPFIVENRPGAGSNIATEAVVRAGADGYTLLMVGPPQVINTTLHSNLSFNFLRDIAAVAPIVRTPNVMEVTPSLPVTTLPDFVAYAKARPGTINMASSGIGTSQHMAGELFKIMTGVDLLHVPYRGIAPALTDLIAGHVHVMFDPILSSIEHIRAGRLRPLALTSLSRMGILDGVPTVSEFVPGYEASSAYGIGAPRGTPGNIVELLNGEIGAILGDPRTRQRLVDMGGSLLTGSPTEFAKLLAEETDKWGRVVKASGAKSD